MVSYNEDSDEATAKADRSSSTSSKKSKSAPLPSKNTGKRKLESVAEVEQGSQDTIQPKRRKPKAKTEESTMPLAERTPVSSLKKLMYIGAHVSAAGGELRMKWVHDSNLAISWFYLLPNILDYLA